MTTVLVGASLVLPDRIVEHGSLIIENGAIAAIETRPVDGPTGALRVDLADGWLLPGFIDVHVHGIEGHDALDDAMAVREMARRLPAYGVTGFCPTAVACPPTELERFLEATADARRAPAPYAAKVLPAHLESNFINPEFAGAQPRGCLRSPRALSGTGDAGFGAGDIIATIARHRPAVGIVTLAPELEGGLDLTRSLTAAGHLVSIGHSGASYEQTHEAIAAGVRHATHLFNRTTPLAHRAPGVPGAVIESSEVAAELICDGHHVHPALLSMVVRSKGASRVMAITDATAGAGLPIGSRTRLGGQTIIVTARTAELENGTLAGSVLTMDSAFRLLVQRVGLTLVDATWLCATSPARQLGLTTCGEIAVGKNADLVCLDRTLHVRDTFIEGVRWRNLSAQALV